MSGVTKGIAVRVHEDVLQCIEKSELERSELIEKAVLNYFGSQSENQNAEMTTDDLSDEFYAEVYNEIYNVEMVPLKQQLRHQQEIMMLLQEKIIGLEEDKKYFKDELSKLSGFASTHKPLFPRFRMQNNAKETKKISSDSGIVEEL